MFVHDLDGLAEASVAQAGQDSAINQSHIHGGSKQKNEDILEEPVEGGLAARQIRGRFGEKKLERRRQSGQRVKRNDEGLREGRDQRIQHPRAELDRRANQLGALFL